MVNTKQTSVQFVLCSPFGLSPFLSIHLYFDRGTHLFVGRFWMCSGSRQLLWLVLFAIETKFRSAIGSTKLSQFTLDLLRTKVEIVCERGNFECNSSQCTINMSASGYRILPVRDSDSTRQKLSTKTKLPSQSPKLRKSQSSDSNWKTGSRSIAKQKGRANFNNKPDREDHGIKCGRN